VVYLYLDRLSNAFARYGRSSNPNHAHRDAHGPVKQAAECLDFTRQPPHPKVVNFGAGSVKFLVKFAIAAAAISGLCGHSHAQAPKAKKNNAAPVAEAAPAPNAAAAEGANTSAPPGWVARCSSASRGAPLECAIEQSAVLTKTGQLIVLINIRVSAETRAPVALVQLPLGLNLPAGAKIQVDDGKTSDANPDLRGARLLRQPADFA
jgi:invasion protein IalB